MPGLAAGPTIFENIKLPEDQFEMHFLEWILPNEHEKIDLSFVAILFNLARLKLDYRPLDIVFEQSKNNKIRVNGINLK